jgi:hypothetical protein
MDLRADATEQEPATDDDVHHVPPTRVRASLRFAGTALRHDARLRTGNDA